MVYACTLTILYHCVMGEQRADAKLPYQMALHSSPYQQKSGYAYDVFSDQDFGYYCIFHLNWVAVNWNE